MRPEVWLVDDERWPVALDTDSGRVYMTEQEATALYIMLRLNLQLISDRRSLRQPVDLPVAA